MDKQEWKTSLWFCGKCLIFLAVYPLWAIFAALGKTDYNHYIKWINDLYKIPSRTEDNKNKQEEKQ